jgi:hypothetical protein
MGLKKEKKIELEMDKLPAVKGFLLLWTRHPFILPARLRR